MVLVKTRGNRKKLDSRHESPFKITQLLAQKTLLLQHVKKETFVKQVTIDVIVPLVEYWNLNK